MTFTFDNSLATELDRVRFEIGDTHDEGHYIENETITYFLTNESFGKAVVFSIEHIITQLSTPDFKQDWSSVSFEKARAGFENLLKLKRQKYGIYTATASSTISHAHRADSYEQLSEPNADGNLYDAPDGRP